MAENSETQKDWSALAVQKIIWDLHITPRRMDSTEDSIYLFLSEQNTKKIVDFLTERETVEFISSQDEVIIPLCLPDSVIREFVQLEETQEEKTHRHKTEHKKRLVYFLENLFGYVLITGLRKQVLKKTVKLRSGKEGIICIDCFNKAEADFLKVELCSYGFYVDTAPCDTCVLSVDLQLSSVSRTSRIVVEFCKQMEEVGLRDVSQSVISTYKTQRGSTSN